MPQRHFADEAAWLRHLERLGIAGLTVTPDPVRIATEGAVWLSIKAHGLLPSTVILSDDAGQFALGRHALCWVHAERLIHKLDHFTHRQHAAQQLVRALVWWFYADLKAYKRAPGRRRRHELRARFDRVFLRRTGFATLDRLLARLHANKEELLLVLERPEVPLNTNGSERDLRPQVIKRKISGGTRSEAGRACRDAFLGLLLTCAKLGVSFWTYLGHRLGVPGTDAPYLPDLVRLRSVSARLTARTFAPQTRIITKPVIERTAPMYLTVSTTDPSLLDRLAALEAKVSALAQASPPTPVIFSTYGGGAASSAYVNTPGLTQKIDQLSGTTLTNVTLQGTVSGITSAMLPTDLTISSVIVVSGLAGSSFASRPYTEDRRWPPSYQTWEVLTAGALRPWPPRAASHRSELSSCPPEVVRPAGDETGVGWRGAAGIEVGLRLGAREPVF